MDKKEEKETQQARAKAGKKAARSNKAVIKDCPADETDIKGTDKTEKCKKRRVEQKDIFGEVITPGEFIKDTTIKLSIPLTLKKVKLYKDERGTIPLFRLVLEGEDYTDDIKGAGIGIDDTIKDFKKKYRDKI